jgi:YbbR domain-containing protein
MKITKLDKVLFFKNSHIVYSILSVLALLLVVSSSYDYLTYEPQNFSVDLSEYDLGYYSGPVEVGYDESYFRINGIYKKIEVKE